MPRVLRVYPAANDPRHRRRDLALLAQGFDMGLVLPYEYGSDWATAPVEPELKHWRSGLMFRHSIPFHLWSTRTLRRAVDEFQPDLVDIHEEPFFPGAFQAVAAAGHRPIVMYAAQTRNKLIPPPFNWTQRYVFDRVSAFYPCCTEAGDLIRSRGFDGAVSVVPLGVEAELFDVRPRGERIGFIGRLTREKGVDLLLAFGPRLLCLGEGPLADDVRSVGGEVRLARTTAELCRGLAEMAVLVAPSITTPKSKEQFGRALAEAMAAGVPVVASDCGAFPEVVGDAGLIFPEGNVDALRIAVDTALEAHASWAEKGRMRARNNFAWDRVAAQLANVYRGALGEAVN